ncbi:MAG: glycosyltransferase family 2 protein [Candidatus Hydrogenedentes bacterium]|nr:glycosyltransferase family 2 protein [Candidatus Hydrogenedentota bacterium]
MAVRLSLVIPAYNEAGRISKTLRDCLDYFARQDYPFEIIVVDDGSHDGTADLVRRDFPEVRLIAYTPNRGKGYAVKQGMLAAQGQYRLFYDADGSTHISEVDKLWGPLSQGADVVIGSRSSPGSQVELHQNPLREFMGRTFNRLTHILLGERFIDTQCGFKAFTEKSTTEIFPRQTLDRFCFDAELLYIARTQNLKITEIPVRWINSPNSRVTLLRDSAQMLKDLFKIRLNALRGKYK